MINISLEIEIKKNNAVLEKCITKAISQTRNILFQEFSEGKEIQNDDISSSTARSPMTHTLAFCKYFDKKNFQNISLSAKEFVRICHKIYTSKSTIRKNDFSLIIPNYQNVQESISATFIKQIIRGIGVMLLSLWRQDAVILTSNFRIPLTTQGTRGEKKEICKSLYSEVLLFFQNFRQPISGEKNYKLKVSKGLNKSLQHHIQQSGWKFIIATDWHKIEDVNVDDSVKFLKAIADHKSGKTSFVPLTTPIKDMLLLLRESFGERVCYTMDDFLNARKEIFNRKIKDSKYSTSSLLSPHCCGDIANFDVRAASKEWAETQENYVSLKRKRGMKSYKEIYKSLKILNEFLFFEIPQFYQAQDKPLIVPSKPKEFTRKYIDGSNGTPSLIDFICDNRSTDTAYGHLLKIDKYFDYLQRESTNRPSLHGFVNPLIRKIDFPLIKRRSGTSKTIICQEHFSPMLSYLYALEQFIWYIVKSLVEESTNFELRSKILNEIENISPAYDTLIETERFGFIPFIYHRGSLYPIKWIHKSSLSLSYRKVKNYEPSKVPNIIHLHQTLISFETGIRHIHIRWLDKDKYDERINRKLPLPPICELVVNTDKVKHDPWTAHVSRRVIILLDKLKYLRSRYNETWVGNSYWYDGHVRSPFGKIKPLFPIGGDRPDGGKPSDDGVYIRKFREFLIAFQEFANDSNLFDSAIGLASCCEYRTSDGQLARKFDSDITPHSARATVVSQHIKILPPWVIGRYITGHENEATVIYYSVIDPQVIDSASAQQNLALKGLHPLLSKPGDGLKIKADDIHSKLRQAINENISEAFSDFGAISVGHEHSEGRIESGISIAKEVSRNQLAHNSTHICPYNNICPKEVILEVGERNCGQCWASIKTVDHLPRIAAHIRALHFKVNGLTERIFSLKAQGVSENILANFDKDRHGLANEVAAWIASFTILEQFRKDSRTRDKYLIKKPDIIEKNLEVMKAGSDELSSILIRVRDAQLYPEFFTEQLNSNLVKLRNKILAKNGDIDRLINQPTGYSQLDEFRGIIRGICDHANVSVEGLFNFMLSEPPSGNPSLIEIL
ncbi:hypothetical protein [Microbulbifer pacificus]|uniref:Integrase n=1 Tax=Microbulbifer pacificus TaxID=407164 RepID=A0AAU0N440_9GAMM|nr:hypothetical protein [Microbulbifer pacificus]WOX07033.1 hypothetical protein R5R33_07845 [Microbulbifer pacificus]